MSMFMCFMLLSSLLSCAGKFLDEHLVTRGSEQKADNITITRLFNRSKYKTCILLLKSVNVDGIILFRPEGAKYNKALEWKIAVVNVQWLNDLLLAHLQALKLPINAKYQQFHLEDPFLVDQRMVTNLMG